LKHAGHVWGLDGLVEKYGLLERFPVIKPLIA